MLRMFRSTVYWNGAVVSVQSHFHSAMQSRLIPLPILQWKSTELEALHKTIVRLSSSPPLKDVYGMRELKASSSETFSGLSNVTQ